MSNSKSKRADTHEIVVSIPEWAIRCYMTEPHCLFQPKPYYRQAIDHAVSRALREYYFNCLMEEILDDSRG